MINEKIVLLFVFWLTTFVCGITVNKRNVPTSISVSNPISGKPINDKDLKGGETRFSNPEPEYYK